MTLALLLIMIGAIGSAAGQGTVTWVDAQGGDCTATCKSKNNLVPVPAGGAQKDVHLCQIPYSDPKNQLNLLVPGQLMGSGAQRGCYFSWSGLNLPCPQTTYRCGCQASKATKRPFWVAGSSAPSTCVLVTVSKNALQGYGDMSTYVCRAFVGGKYVLGSVSSALPGACFFNTDAAGGQCSARNAVDGVELLCEKNKRK